MKLSDLKNIIIDNLDAGISTELRSSPGRGKSQFIAQLVKELSERDGEEWGFATCFLATMTPSDLMGYMVPTKLEDGSLASVFTTPPWMMTAPTPQHPKGRDIRHFKRGIVFLDEYGQGDGDTKKAAAELLLSGKIGPHQLPPGIGVIAASNGAKDRSGVTKDFDFVINRRMQIEITDDIAGWQEWAVGAGMMPLTMAFAEQNPQIVFAEGVPEKQGPWCTPRTLEMADRLMQRKMARLGGELPDDPVTVEALQGLIGAGAAAQFMAFVKMERDLPKLEDIVKDPMKAKLPTKVDAQMLACHSLAARVTQETAGAVVTYIDRLNKEFAVTFFKNAISRNMNLVKVPEVSKWVSANAALVASITMNRGTAK